MNRLDLTKDIIQVPMPTNQYVAQVTEKNQIVLHGTASNPHVSGKNVFDYWNQTPERVATCVVVAGDGKIYQGFSSKYWAGHIGPAHGFGKFGIKPRDCSINSIGVEISNWGFLTKVGQKYYSWTGAEVPKEEVQEYAIPFRGQHYYQKYTQAQIDAVEKLLRYWSEIYNIPLDYTEMDLWNLSRNAHAGVPGVYTHNSFRLDKSDIHPQPEMVQMLKKLSKEI